MKKIKKVLTEKRVRKKMQKTAHSLRRGRAKAS